RRAAPRRRRGRPSSGRAPAPGRAEPADGGTRRRRRSADGVRSRAIAAPVIAPGDRCEFVAVPSQTCRDFSGSVNSGGSPETREGEAWSSKTSTLAGVFTGIVRERGRVAAVDGGADGVRLRIEAPETARRVAIGDSVSIDGVCLTVTELNGVAVAFEAVPETLSRSTLGTLRAESEVNLEVALRAGEPLGGHYVQGHVDGLGRIRTVELEGDGRRIWIDAPPEVLRYCVEKGSIAVQGV